MGKLLSRSAHSRGDTVTLRRSEYERLLAKAGESVSGDGPPLPKPDARGNFPAVEYLRASIARELIRRRRVAGLTQSELAELAHVRQETISRIESGKHTVGERVMASIERVLAKRRPAIGRRAGKKVRDSPES
jgi:DNA-binding XRE family transcriptional regulator